MKNSLKLIIPLVLGLIAGVFNYMALKSSVEEVSFIKAKSAIQIGEMFTSDKVEKMTIMKQHAEGLADSAIRYADIGLLSGQVATRRLYAGDVILYRDTGGLTGEIYDFREGDEAALPVSLDGIPTPPKMRVGDLVELKIPASANDSEGSSKWIGPFRLVSVGKTISNQNQVTESKRISVAYEDKNKEQLEELERFIDRQTSEGARLVSIKLKVQTQGSTN